jgi:hypothetical protein
MYALPFELSMGTEVLTEKYEYTLYRIYINRNPVKAVFKVMRLVPFNKTETTVTFLFK